MAGGVRLIVESFTGVAGILASLKKHIGDAGYNKLQARDDVLDGWAHSIKPPAVKSGGSRPRTREHDLVGAR